MIRTAERTDLDAVERLYNEIHDAEEAGIITTGWIRNIYPTRATAEAALDRGDLFVMEDDNVIIGAAIINQIQVNVYSTAPWKNQAPDDEICVLHTLVISPKHRGKGCGRRFIDFYESYARRIGCTELRIDTNKRNQAARMMYAKNGYTEIATVPTVFNGIPGVDLVLLEKDLYKPLRLRYACILTDYGELRWIVARLEGMDHPLVFKRTVLKDEAGHFDNHCLYRDALTVEQADEILDAGENGEKRKANTLLKRYVKLDGAICEDVGEIQLDDRIPDDWYDAWKAMESVITISIDLPGYYEEVIKPE